ncbi:hypothetical protein [Chthoniobacter sp.]|uniref:hypothetical protein n=1 Tax=Chthoniobacter sp. TaxID=2510640 RepID=UPI0032AF2168
MPYRIQLSRLLLQIAVSSRDAAAKPINKNRVVAADKMSDTNKTPKELLREVQAEAMAKVNESRFRLLLAHDEADEINADDDYKVGILDILGKYENGLSLGKFARVFPDVPELRVAKEALIKEGKIKESKEGTQKVLALTSK